VPVLLALRLIEIEPGEVAQLLRQLQMPALGPRREVRGDPGARPAAAAVGEDRDERAGMGKTEILRQLRAVDGDRSVLDEMVSRARGAELLDGPVAQLPRDRQP